MSALEQPPEQPRCAMCGVQLETVEEIESGCCEACEEAAAASDGNPTDWGDR